MGNVVRALAVLSAVAFAMPLSADAAIIEFTANLKGENERPTPVVTEAEGLALLLLNDVTYEFQLTVLADEFPLGELVAAHIHVGGPEDVGPPIVGLGAPDSFSEIGGVLFTVFEGTFPEPNRGDLFAGNTYVNLHSRTHGGGEIRGQLIPEPATLALLGGAIAGIGIRRRRK